MKCPVCPNTDLLMTERSGIEIDYCPHCRGVWLDRGELDKIIERSLNELPQTGHQASRPAPQAYRNNSDHHDKHHSSHNDYRNKKSFWNELFD